MWTVRHADPVGQQVNAHAVAARRKAQLSVLGHGVEMRASPLGGMGLFATRAFEVGDWVTTYDGRIISKREADALLGEGGQTHMVTLDLGHTVIDGYKPWELHDGMGGGSVANDRNLLPDGTYLRRDTNNTYQWWWYRPDGSKTMVLRARTPIAAGDEITWKYMDTPSMRLTACTER